jgi:hypothetical protein
VIIKLYFNFQGLLGRRAGEQKVRDTMHLVAFDDLGENLWHYGLRLSVEGQPVLLLLKF